MTDETKLMPEYYIEAVSNEYETTIEIRQHLTHKGKQAYRVVADFDVHDLDLAEKALAACNTRATPNSEAAERVRVFVEKYSKRSSYGWSDGANYSAQDFKNEGELKMAEQILRLLEKENG